MKTLLLIVTFTLLGCSTGAKDLSKIDYDSNEEGYWTTKEEKINNGITFQTQFRIKKDVNISEIERIGVVSTGTECSKKGYKYFYSSGFSQSNKSKDIYFTESFCYLNPYRPSIPMMLIGNKVVESYIPTLKPNDTILSINSKSVIENNIVSITHDLNIGSTAKIKILRGDQELIVKQTVLKSDRVYFLHELEYFKRN